MTPICKICRGGIFNEDYLVKSYPEWSDIIAGLSIQYCKDCGFGYVPLEKEEHIAKIPSFYRKIYRGIGAVNYINFNLSYKAVVSIDHRSFSQWSLASLFYSRPFVESFLDVGPGLGMSFDVVRNIHPEAQLFALELAAGAHDFYRREYGASCVESINDIPDKIDIVFMSHSLEHLPYQQAVDFLLELREKMDVQSVLMIEVPHVDLRINTIKKVRGQDDPHLLFFSTQALRTLAESLGFSVEFMATCGQSWEQPDAASEGETSFFARLAISILRSPSPLIAPLRSFARKLFWPRLLLDSPDFKYHGNRDCIRTILRKVT